MRLRLTLMFILTMSFTAHAAIDSSELHSYLNLLLSSNPVDSKLGARSIAQDKITVPEAWDLIAEQLASGVAMQTDVKYVDTLAWYARSLGMSGNGRYRALLERMQQQYTNVKITRHIDAALKMLPEASVPAFEPGKLSIAEMKTELTRLQQASQTNRSGEISESALYGKTLREVSAQLGLPDHVIASENSFKPHAYVRVREAMLTSYYYGFGVVQFSYDPSRNPGWVVAEIVPELTDAATAYQGPNRAFAFDVVSARGNALREALLSQLALFDQDKALLEVAAARLVVSPSPMDKFEADALSYLCRALGNSQDSRYHAVLQKVIAENDNNRTVMNAKTALANIPAN